MDLTTRCPECGATFLASLDQLKRRKGYVRCVECANIFDGFESVVDEADAAMPATLAMPPQARQTSVKVTRSAAGDGPWSAGAEPSLWLDDDSDPHSSVLREDRFVVPDQSVSTASTGQRIDDEEGVSAIFVEPRRRRNHSSAVPAFLSNRRRGLGVWGLFRWLFVLMILAAVAGALVYTFRTQVAAEVPQSRPLLEKACQWLGCTVDYPQRIDRIAIMDSQLQAMSGSSGAQAGTGSNVMQLTVVMRNTYDKAQQWPALTLDLVDLAGVVVSRRILQPADYLDARQLQGPFGAGQEVRLALRVVAEGLSINGFKLGKFFPKKD